MHSELSGAWVRSSGHPVLRILVSFPIACFTCALFTDIAYMVSASTMWADFSAWLLAVGMVGAVLSAVAGIAALVAERRVGLRRPVWRIVLGSLVAFVIALLNNLVHSRDAWTSVVPVGVVLSAATVLVMLATVWAASSAWYWREVAVPYPGGRP